MMELDKEYLLFVVRTLPNTTIPLFVAIDIFYIMPVYMALTMDFSPRQKKKVALQSVLTAFFVCLLFITLGEAIFRIIGITVDDFKIAGGLLLLVIAVLEIVKREKEVKVSEDIGIVPIGVPLIVGPAVLTTLLILMEHFGMLPTIIGLMINLMIIWISFKTARIVVNKIGKNIIMIMSKLLAILLASIAIMMIRMGMINMMKTGNL